MVDTQCTYAAPTYNTDDNGMIYITAMIAKVMQVISLNTKRHLCYETLMTSIDVPELSFLTSAVPPFKSLPQKSHARGYIEIHTETFSSKRSTITWSVFSQVNPPTFGNSNTATVADL